MSFDIDRARMKSIVLLDGIEFSKVVAEFYGKPYSTPQATRDYEVYNGSLVTADASGALEMLWDGDSDNDSDLHLYAKVAARVQEWVNQPEAERSWDEPAPPHPGIIIADLVRRGEVADLNYQIYVWW